MIIYLIIRLQKQITVNLDLSNYTTKTVLKSATGSDTLKFAKKANLASLKSAC